MRVRFGECQLDSEAHELTRGGRALSITPKAFELLRLLLEGRPRALSKATLRDRLWPKTYVAHTSLPRLVNEIRRAIGDDAAEPRLIRTVYGVGYAFSGNVVESGAGRSAAASGCSLLWGARSIPLALGENVLGRAPDAVVSIASPRVSRHHARIVVEREEATLEDLRSKNGTLLRGALIQRAERLADGDEIVIGPEVLVFRKGASDSTLTDSSKGRPRRTRA